MIAQKELVSYLEKLLDTASFKDYCPNGLQIEGKPHIKRIVTGVTANLALLDAAIAAHADAIIVHHGYFWRNEPTIITGARHTRIKRLLMNDINLFAFHLPLDAHPQLGNNIQLGQQLGLSVSGHFGQEGLAVYCDLPAPMALPQLMERVYQALHRPAQLFGLTQEKDRQPVQRVGWCTGAAQSYFDAAIAADCDVFLSGEVSEHTVHTAVESGVPYLAIGHHASERYGVQALGEHLAEKFGLEHQFIEIANPV